MGSFDKRESPGMDKEIAMTTRILNSILVKPAGPDCNLACDYCFYREKSELFPGSPAHRMGLAVLEEMMRTFMEGSGREVSIGWQGGEPTLMGLPFFEKAVEFEERYGKGRVVGNGIQTNGLLLDEQWARFFSRYKFLVGLSIDGPAHVHDHYRVNASGGGSWERVSRSARLLLDAGVAVNALTVVNDYSARFPDEIYDHHRAAGLDFMQFIPCVEPGPAGTTGAAAFSAGAEAYGQFLCRIFDRWRRDFKGGSPTSYVRYFESLLFLYAGLAPPECTLLDECGSYLVVEHNGDVYACDFFVEPAWRLGNIKEDDLSDMLNSARQGDFGRIKADLPPECAACPWIDRCRGGCTKDRMRVAGDGGSNHFCGAYKIFFEHADSELRHLADEWRRTQAAAPRSSAPAGRNEPCPCGSGLKYKKCCGNV